MKRVFNQTHSQWQDTTTPAFTYILSTKHASLSCFKHVATYFTGNVMYTEPPLNHVKTIYSLS